MIRAETISLTDHVKVTPRLIKALGESGVHQLISYLNSTPWANEPIAPTYFVHMRNLLNEFQDIIPRSLDYHLVSFPLVHGLPDFPNQNYFYNPAIFESVKEAARERAVWETIFFKMSTWFWVLSRVKKDQITLDLAPKADYGDMPSLLSDF